MDLLDYIYSVEGDKIHYNSTEEDITSPGGIYRFKHSNAKIFEYIDSVAASSEIYTKSNEWSKEDLNVINNNLDMIKVNELVMDFYTEYNKGAYLELFTPLVQTTVFSLYTNSPINAWKSIQSAINKFCTNDIIDYDIQVVDGKPGKKTFKGLEAINEVCYDCSELELLFESYILLEMSKIYAKLAVSNPDKFLIYLNGWNNRLDFLAKN